MTEEKFRIYVTLIALVIFVSLYLTNAQMKMVLISVYLICGGGLLIVGTKLRWWLLTDPPKEWGYTHSWLKRTFGVGFLIPYNYFLGLVFLLIGLAILASMYS